MHHSFHITVPSDRTDALLDEIDDLDEVVSVAVHRGASHKPPGDSIELDVLNRGADAVLALVERTRQYGEVSVRSSTVDSLIDPSHAKAIAGDLDETVWEDAETSLRHHSQLGANYLAAMALGGIIAASGLLMRTSTQSTAMVAAAVIAPGFEPLAKLPLAIVLRRKELFVRGLRSVVPGYAVLAAAAALTIGALDIGGYPVDVKLLHNHLFSELVHPSALALVVSAAGALAGAVMIAAHRIALLPGPLIALQLIPATALVGGAAEQGDGTAVAEGLGRLGIDAGMVIVAGLIVFGYKQAALHRRKPVV